ncbi:MAG: hypothetical protein Greene101449_1373, partial [Candidatus Peregrinibacteria bacterium Greene1014_49]
ENVLTVAQFNQIIVLLEKAQVENTRIEQEKAEALLLQRQELRAVVSGILNSKGGRAKVGKGTGSGVVAE